MDLLEAFFLQTAGKVLVEDGSMKIIAFIEQEEVVKKILKHVGLWEVKSRPPSKIHFPPDGD